MTRFDDSLTGASRLTRRLHYQAMSVLPSGPQAQMNADPLPASLRAAYLQLPPLDPRIFSLANRITSGANSIEEKARRIESYLLSNYRYSLDPLLVEQSQPVSAFLFQSRRGHCEYFASAMAVMSRSLGISCRVVNGFRNGEYNDIGGDYIIRGKDAHSWVEAYFPGTGWQSYDPTPAGDPSPAESRLYLAINNYLDAFELFWGEWVLGYDDVIQDALFRDLQDQSSRWLFRFQSKLYRQTLRFQELASLRNIESRLQIDYSRNRLALYLGGLIVVLLLFLSRRLAEELRIRRLRKDGQRSSAIAFYSEMMGILERRGKRKPPSWTPIEFLESLPAGALKTKVEEMTQLYNELRFSLSRT